MSRNIHSVQRHNVISRHKPPINRQIYIIFRLILLIGLNKSMIIDAIIS
jgi:hypothetical protein